jgi:hypothetical protein
LHKRAPNAKEIPITVSGKQIEYQMDLLDMSNFSRENKGIKWVLILEDILDRKVHAVAIKSKSPIDVLPALKIAIEKLGHQPVQIVSDSGSEWKGAVAKWLSEQKIAHRTVEVGDHNSLGIIDSAARFVKNSLHKHFTNKQTTNWVDVLESLIMHYNDTPHSSLKAKGAPAMSPNESEQYETDTRNIHIAAKNKAAGVKNNLAFAVGDHVRVLKRKKLFARGYEVRYSIKTFTIEKQDGHWYVLNDGRRFREGSLQRINAPLINEVPDTAPIRDVAAASKRDHRVDQILIHKEGVVQENRREGLRERKPQSLVEDMQYGRVLW